MSALYQALIDLADARTVAKASKVIYLQDLAVRQAWTIVGKAWQDCHEACEECSFNKVEIEHAPYGEGHAPYASSECTLGQFTRDDPNDCPALQAIAAAEREDEVSDAQCAAVDSTFAGMQ